MHLINLTCVLFTLLSGCVAQLSPQVQKELYEYAEVNIEFTLTQKKFDDSLMQDLMMSGSIIQILSHKSDQSEKVCKWLQYNFSKTKTNGALVNAVKNVELFGCSNLSEKSTQAIQKAVNQESIEEFYEMNEIA